MVIKEKIAGKFEDHPLLAALGYALTDLSPPRVK
jgi:hypothetical protein